MSVNVESIKILREKTSAGLADIKNALDQAGGDTEKAMKLLAEKGLASAGKRADRATGQGIIYSYVHNNRIGVMLELNCETDFVARNDDFKELAKELAIQIVLNNAVALTEEELEDPKETDRVLLTQKFYKDSSLTVDDYIKLAISKFGENIKLSRFTKMLLGE